MSALRSRLGAVLIATLAAILGALGEPSLLAGWSFDQTLALRHLFIGDRHEVARSPVVVLAIDEATFDHPSLRDIPMALWNPQFGRTIAALDEAGAKVIGLDIIPTTTAESIAPGHDRPLIEAIQRTGAAGRLVMARADFDNRALLPHRIFAFLAGPANIRSVNISLDGDGIARRLPLTLQTEQGPVATLVGEMARRAGALPSFLAGGAVHFANFSDAGIVPTYSMGEVLTCIEAGKVAELGADFKDRIVLLGATLDVEDRKSASARAFVDPGLALRHLDCAGDAPARNVTKRSTLPGVYILAQAVNDLVRGEVLTPVPGWARGLIAGLMATMGAFMGWKLSAARGALACLLLLLAWFSLSGIVASADVLLPAGAGSVSLIGAFAGVFGLRALLIEREKRRLAHALGRYLDEKVALALLSGEQPIELGGESREITVWFSDIAGFSTISENAEPRELVRRLNQHFSVLGEAIEAEGGIIDKFVGDAIVAVFGAPERQPDHAARALRAAGRVMRKLKEQPNSAGGFKFRIGLNTGVALVGNVGSNRRFDYTAIGDAVNVAQRLEAANKEHGTTVLVSAATAAAAGPGFQLRPVGAISLKGREGQVEALELLTSHSPLPLAGEGASADRASG